MATERRIGKTSDEDSNDTVRVEKLEPDEILTPPPAAPRAPGMTRGIAPRPLPSATPTPSPPSARSYMHMPAPDDMTPLPPPRVQASIIAEESSLPPPSVPLPLPPAPSTSRPQAERPLERASLVPRRISLPGAPTAQQLIDAGDAAWTLGLRIASGVLALAFLAWIGKIFVDAAELDIVPLWALLPVVLLLLAYPALFLAQRAVAARVATSGIEVGAEQLREAWQLYVDVAVRLGINAPPPLFVFDASAWQRRLLPLARRSCIVVRWSAFASNESLELAFARELGARLLGHDEPLDAALLLPARIVFGVLAFPLRRLGLGFSPMQLLAASRVFSHDRAACVGTGDLGLVTDDIIGDGDRTHAVRVDVVALDAQHRRVGGFARVLHELTSPVPSLAERVRRLQAFAGPHLVQ